MSVTCPDTLLTKVWYPGICCPEVEKMYDHAPNGSVEMLWLAILWVNKFWHKPGLCRKKSIFPCLAPKPWLWHHFITETIHPFKNNVLILIYGWFLMFTKSFIQRLIDVRHDTSFRNQVVKFSIYSRILGIVQSIKAKYIFFLHTTLTNR